ncbi:hypothetical protein [Pelotomaculum propionicicum]|uniref:Uncharacterized protein n=1 Tax=Pelotomaculum propionicicum TaxID=258475 RepID=A0A4Y7RWK6_9FIRM|nr:hypothetical protein [Pelotomaculum propionicicum]TEB13388.1 hypothetical protein Pmgp_00282 [Pelotomaculum propionicicum]
MRKQAVIILILLIAAMLAVNIYLLKGEPQEPAVNIDQRLTQLEQANQDLRAEMEDVKSVQGYMAWEKDWRNRRQGP